MYIGMDVHTEGITGPFPHDSFRRAARLLSRGLDTLRQSSA
jgi:hypothetical protein